MAHRTNSDQERDAWLVSPERVECDLSVEELNAAAEAFDAAAADRADLEAPLARLVAARERNQAAQGAAANWWLNNPQNHEVHIL